MSLPKWTPERTETLVKFVGDESPVSQETVAGAAEALETTPRSVASKLRKMDYEVELANAHAHRAYTEAQEETLRTFVESNPGEYTYAEIAKLFEDGAFSPKSIQGKILSMELTDLVKAAPKPASVRTYTPEEEAVIIQMINDGAYVEAIAEALDRTVNSIRGKALSLLRAEEISKMPTQEHTKSENRKDALAELGDLVNLTVAAIAEAIQKTERGVKTMLTRRGLTCSDWDGAERKAKAASAAE